MSKFPAVDPAARQQWGLTGLGLWNDKLLDSYLDEAVERCANSEAVIDGQKRLCYRELGALVARAAGGLRRCGVRRGEVVSFQLPNWWESLVLHLAVVRIGAVSNPLLPILRERELRYMLHTAGSKVFVTASRFRNFDHAMLGRRLQAELPGLQLLIVRASDDMSPRFEDLLDSADGEPDANRAPDDPVVLLYTSGTESDPKAAVHSHNTIGYDNRSIIETYALSRSDVVFMPSPLAHITGVLYGFHLATMLATKVVYQDVWEPGIALSLIERERCSFTVAATPFLHSLAYSDELPKRDISSLRVFGCGGADVPPHLIREASERLDCCALRLYGSTEFPTLSSGQLTDSVDRRASTDGRPIGHAEARVVDEEGVALPAGAPGRLLARGPEAFLGYLSQDRSPKDEDGWFDTGDAAVIDEEGYIQITGRIKDIVVRGGENIAVKEVEDLLRTHPDVAEVAIVAMPDPWLGERACAFVVPRNECVVELQTISAFLDRFGIARQKYPERVELIDTLPKTATGKVQKFYLREQLAQRMAADQPS